MNAAAIDRLVALVAEDGDPAGALGRIQNGLLAQAAKASGLHPSAMALFDPAALSALPALADPAQLSRFYERLQQRLQPAQRRALGQYFTPQPIVAAMWALAREALRQAGANLRQIQAVDPAAGSGAFLMEGLHQGLSGAQLLGVEILDSAVRTAEVSLAVSAGPRAAPRVLHADAYSEPAFEAMARHLGAGQAALVIGNPPYNGKSELLRDPLRLASARARLLPFAGHHTPHSGFRDDFVYFLGLAHALVQQSGRPGVICFITPSSLLDARDHQGLRHFLRERYRVQVVDVGPGAFPDARVATCITVLTLGQTGARYFELGPSRDEALAALAHSPALAGLGEALSPQPPDAPLRPLPALPSELATEVDPITSVVQRWLTPHKTGFDELLVDVDPVALWDRLIRVRDGEPLQGFESPRLARKLAAARAWARGQPSFPVRGQLGPYLRYNPRFARFAAPADQWQQVYFEPRIATLFNHAFKGTVGRFRPHQAKPQLLFNTFEHPLFAMVVQRPAVLHLYQHARFAPLHVPEGFWRARDEKVEHPDRGPQVLNLSPAWQARAALLRRPDDVFHLLVGLFQSALTRNLFGPRFGRRHPLPIKRFDASLAPVAQRIADRARLLAEIESRGDSVREPLVHLSDDVCRLYLGDDPSAEALRETELWQATQA